MTITSRPIDFAGYSQKADAPSLDLIRQCVHCGLCLPTCPTYAVLGLEADSPRGRIQLMKGVHDERLGVNDAFELHMYRCLDCRACETACPSGVQFGKLVEAARSQVEEQRGRPLHVRALRRLVFGLLLPHPGLLALAARLARAGVPLARATLAPFAARVPLAARLARLTTLLPDRALVSEGVPEVVPAIGARRGRALLFLGCVMRAAFGDVNAATARVLSRNGWEVLGPRDQTCCGALHVHAGERDGARALARSNIERLERHGADVIVANAAGCGANLKEYGWLLRDDPTYAARAEAFAAKVRDVTEVLADGGLRETPGPLALRATYDDPCHLLHGQKVREQPRAILSAIPSLELLPLAEADWCCGSAGIYNLTEPELSRRLLERKVGHILATGAEAVVTANPGCAMQIEAGLREVGKPLPVLHIVEVLDRAYGGASAGVSRPR